MGGLIFRAAKPDESGVVEALLTDASGWLASRGINQWREPPRRAKILAAIARGECFLAQTDGVVVGTITIDDLADSDFWTDDDLPAAALYVHRMAVVRTAAGRGLGGIMLDWAAARARETGKSWLRLDAWKTNLALHRYYRGQGFALLRVVDLPHRQSGALFQRSTGFARGNRQFGVDVLA
ncbi:GNAT family N-acetyltransferase [Micromonospora sp. NPDC003197]